MVRERVPAVKNFTWPWPGEVSEGTGRARLCAYVKDSTLNFAIEQELRDRRVDGRANATSPA